MARKNKQYTSGTLRAALDSIKTGLRTLGEASRVFGIPKSTLSSRMNKNHVLEIGAPCKLQKSEEESLKSWILRRAERGYPIDREKTRTKAGEIFASRTGSDASPLSESWYRGFLQRNPEISSRIHGSKISRATANISEADLREIPKKTARVAVTPARTPASYGITKNHKNIDAALGQLYFHTEYPIQLARSPEWKKLIALLNPQYTMPSVEELRLQFKEEFCYLCEKHLSAMQKSLSCVVSSSETGCQSHLYEILESMTGNELTEDIRKRSAVCSECFEDVKRFKCLEWESQDIQSTLISKYLRKQPTAPQIFIKSEPDVDFSDFGSTIDDESDFFQCDNCESVFTIKQELQEHCTTHTKPETKKISCQFDCDECEIDFATSLEWELHRLTDHGKSQGPFSCKLCSDLLDNRDLLRDHLVTHKQNKDHVMCSVCGASVKRNRIKIHMMIHDDVRPFECEFSGCGKKFRLAAQRVIHHRVHTGEKPFSCPHCPDKKFAQSYGRDLHIKRQHNSENSNQRSTEALCRICGITVSSEAKLREHLTKTHAVVDSDYEMGE